MFFILLTESQTDMNPQIPSENAVVAWSKDDAFKKKRCTTFGEISFANNDNAKPAKVKALNVIGLMEHEF